MTLDRRTLLAAGAGSLLMPKRALAAGPAETADVIVIGAGLAGLHSALLLAEEGARVLVLEGRQRPGGRLFTLDDVPGAPEAGGSGIGSGYGRILDRARRLGVALGPARARTEVTPETAHLHLGGENILAARWGDSARNPFEGPLRAAPPWGISFRALVPYNPLPSADAWRAPEFAAQDVSVADFLAARGWNEDQLRLAFATNPSYGNSAHDLSVLMWWHIAKNAEAMTMAGSSGPMAIAGGNQRLPEAMARALGERVRYGSHVIGLRHDARGAEAVTLDGRTYRGKLVISTMPASALRLVRIDPAPPAAQARAIEQISYNSVVQVHFVPKRRFWEEDGLPPGMWTDTLAGRFMALRYGRDPSDVTCFVAFVNGLAAQALDRMGAARATAAVQAAVEAARPAARGALRPVRFTSWQLDPFAGGAYACWGPGQVRDFANVVARPMGRLLLAGEHTSAFARGMEGAMESAERVAIEALAII